MTKADARVIFSGLIPEGFQADRLTPRGKAEVRAAIDKILELTGVTNDAVLAPHGADASIQTGNVPSV